VLVRHVKVVKELVKDCSSKSKCSNYCNIEEGNNLLDKAVKLLFL
jgi:hypothetical protein